MSNNDLTPKVVSHVVYGVGYADEGRQTSRPIWCPRWQTLCNRNLREYTGESDSARNWLKSKREQCWDGLSGLDPKFIIAITIEV
jgi:hypothetical protein